MIRGFRKIFLLFAAGAVFYAAGGLSSCNVLTNVEPASSRPDSVARTFFVYMAGDNSLSTSDQALQSNILQLISAATRENLNGGRILVYYSPMMHYGSPGSPSSEFNFDSPRMIEIYPDRNDQGAWRTLKVYPQQSAASPVVLRQAVDDMISFAPADSYCIDFASHGTGWLPAILPTPDAAVVAAPAATPARASASSSGTGSAFASVTPPVNYSFGMEGDGSRDSTYQMNIEDLAAALPDHKFDFIMFDACMMGSVEVAYELRNKTPWIIASPSEIPGPGFPYEAIVKDIFAGDGPYVRAICQEYINKYDNAPSDRGTIGLYNTANIPALAAVTGEIASQYAAAMAAMQPFNTQPPKLQYYFTYLTSYSNAGFTALDMGDGMNLLLSAVDPVLLENFKSALSNVVVYSASTNNAKVSSSNPYGQLFPSSSRPFDPARFSGITMHIPMKYYDTMTYYDPFYQAYVRSWNAFLFDHTAWGREILGPWRADFGQ